MHTYFYRTFWLYNSLQVPYHDDITAFVSICWEVKCEGRRLMGLEMNRDCCKCIAQIEEREKNKKLHLGGGVEISADVIEASFVGQLQFRVEIAHLGRKPGGIVMIVATVVVTALQQTVTIHAIVTATTAGRQDAFQIADQFLAFR